MISFSSIYIIHRYCNISSKLQSSIISFSHNTLVSPNEKFVHFFLSRTDVGHLQHVDLEYDETDNIIGVIFSDDWVLESFKIFQGENEEKWVTFFRINLLFFLKLIREEGTIKICGNSYLTHLVRLMQVICSYNGL